MKSSKNSLLRCAVAAALVLIHPVVDRANGRNVLLSIYTDNVGVVSPSGRHLYAVVTTDGEMTYADRLNKEITDRKRELTATELSRLRAAVRDPNLREIHGTRSDKSRTHVDYQMSVIVTITTGDAPHEFTLVNYDEADGRYFPPGAKELLCTVDDLRQSSYRITRGCK